MEKIYRFSSWWCRLVLPIVHGPEGWGWGASSEHLAGLGHLCWRIASEVLGSVLYEPASWLRNYSFTRIKTRYR